MGHLGGLCSSLLASGTSGRHPQNVKRDILRKLAARNPESQVPCQNKQPLLHFKHVSDHVSSQIQLCRTFEVPVHHVPVPLDELGPDGNYTIEQRPIASQ